MARKLNKIQKQNNEIKSVDKHFRCTPSRAEQIKSSDFTVDEMLDFFFLFSEDEHFEKLIKLKELKSELYSKKKLLSNAETTVGKLKDDIILLEIEMEKIQDTMKDGNYNLKEYSKAKRIHNSIQTTLKYYSTYYNPNNNPNMSIDDFIASSNTRSYVKRQATMCGLDFDDFVAELVKAYNESGMQQVLI